MNEEQYRKAERALWNSVGAQPSERMVRLERTGAVVRIQEVGDGDPVVFVHGASNGGASWASLAARLGTHRCVLVDRPGCGLSPRVDRSLADMAALGAFADGLMIDVLEAIDVDVASVIGTSFGGYFVLRAAAAHPGRIDRVVTLTRHGWTTRTTLRRSSPSSSVTDCEGGRPRGPLCQIGGSESSTGR